MINETYKIRAELFNFDLLDNNKSKLKLQCKEGHIFERNFANLLTYNECPQCKINSIKQNKYINVKIYIEYQNFILLSKEYVNQYTKLDLQCHNGHIFKKDYKTVKKEGIKCPECSLISQKGIKKVAAPIKDVIDMFELEGYNILHGIETYQNERSEFQLICPNNHIFTTNRFKFYHKKSRCPECNTSKKLDLKFCQEKFLKRDYILLEDKYINSGTNMAYICKNHNDKIQYMCWDNFNQGKGCKFCATEKVSEDNKLSYEYVFNEFNKRNCILLEDKYINNSTLMKYMCNNHKGIIQYIRFSDLCRNNGCKYCGIENRSGENHPNWKGGITTITNYLRNNIKDWKIDSMKSCNYKCIVTGERFDDIHHLYGFDLIMMETFKITNIQIKQTINDYTQSELDLLVGKINELHYEYGLGVCLTESIHTLFHQIYNYGNNMPEQFEEFKLDLKSGIFNDYLIKENIKLII